jgi:hypothetical protein
VIYVMGAGHSGSTVLGVVLGNCAGFAYAGEVEEWLTMSGTPAVGGVERNEFWKTVREEMAGAGAQELFGGGANRSIERSSALLRIDNWSTRRKIRADYRRVTEELFRVIANTAGANQIVDTSHFPLRARELQKLSGLELFLVFLVRDPQDVVASNVRDISRHEVAERRIRILAMNANIWLTQLLSTIVFLAQPRRRRVFVRHEDFLADPEGVTRQVLDSLGFDAEVPDLDSLRVAIALEGNKLITSDSIAVRRSNRQVVRWSRLTQLIQLCWVPVLSRLRPVAAARLERVSEPPLAPRRSE